MADLHLGVPNSCIIPNWIFFFQHCCVGALRVLRCELALHSDVQLIEDWAAALYLMQGSLFHDFGGALEDGIVTTFLVDALVIAFGQHWKRRERLAATWSLVGLRSEVEGEATPLGAAAGRGVQRGEPRRHPRLTWLGHQDLVLEHEVLRLLEELGVVFPRGQC